MASPFKVKKQDINVKEFLEERCFHVFVRLSKQGAAS
jgi:hypothetical protein